MLWSCILYQQGFLWRMKHWEQLSYRNWANTCKHWRNEVWVQLSDFSPSAVHNHLNQRSETLWSVPYTATFTSTQSSTKGHWQALNLWTVLGNVWPERPVTGDSMKTAPGTIWRTEPRVFPSRSRHAIAVHLGTCFDRTVISQPGTRTGSSFSVVWTVLYGNGWIRRCLLYRLLLLYVL